MSSYDVKAPSDEETMSSEEQEFVLLENKDVQDFNEDALLPLSDKDLEDVNAWLQPTDYAAESSEYRKHLASHLPGTCNWIQQTQDYKDWHDGSERGCLWIKAVAGAGKSVAAAMLALNFAKQERAPVVYFFFRQIITANQKPHSLLRDYLSQLLTYSPYLQHQFKKWIDDRRSLDSISLTELWKTLQSAIAPFSRIYCVADALDEMDEDNEEFLFDLVKLGQLRPTSIKLLLTSRPLPRVEKVLRDRSVLQIALQENLVEPDILLYIKHRLSHYKMSEPTRRIAEGTIHRRSKGLFLYARLVIDDVLDPVNGHLANEESLELALAKVPHCLAEIYTKMLVEHSQRTGVSQELQITILRWVTRSERPLRLLELANMIDFKQKRLGSSKDTKSIVRKGCGPLLEILEDETVCVIHHSLTEFLFDKERCESNGAHGEGFPLLDYANTQRAIALTCIQYLTTSGWYEHFDVRSLKSPCYSRDGGQTSQQLKLKFPFLMYAVSNWYIHVNKYGDLDEGLLASLDGLMLNETAFKAWSTFDISQNASLRHSEKRSDYFTPIHAAAAKGLSNYVVRLIGLGHAVDEVGHLSRTPLFRSAEQGHDRVVETLLAHGAEKDRDDDVGLKPLIVAASANRHKVVTVLLQAGVDPFTPKTKEWPGRSCGNAPTTVGDTAVEYACQSSHVETVQALMPFLDNDGLHTALYWATRFGSTKAVKALLESPEIDINRLIRGKTPIFLAAHARDMESIQLLLDKGADVGILSDNVFKHGRVHITRLEVYQEKFTPLHAFVNASAHTYGREKDAERIKSGFHLLLDAGCDVNAADAWNNTALGLIIASASDSGHDWREDMVRSLLERGASVCIKREGGSNLLHNYRSNNAAIARLLIEHGVNVNEVRSSDGLTPLMASKNSLLLDFGANCNVADLDGNTILHIVAKDYNLKKETVEKFLDAGASLTAQNQDGDTPLHIMSRNMSSEFLEFCLEHGGNLESRNHKGLTVLLHSFSSWGPNNKFRELIEGGADVHAIDYDGRTILHMLCKSLNTVVFSTTDMMKDLVERGVDPKRTNHAGDTLLHETSKTMSAYHQGEQNKLLNLLLDLGVSPDIKNNHGELPLHIACKRTDYISYRDPLEFFLGPRCRSDINAADNDGVRPIHIAATYSERLVARLLSRGADPTLLTNEGHSPLIIAARARQSNIVGMLIEYLQEAGKHKCVHQTDKQGRSALHHACRAGRRESVKLLLEAGADPNLKDKQLHTPLFACAEFDAENSRWKRNQPSNSSSGFKSAFVVSTDQDRPIDGCHGSDFVGVRGVIRLLIEYGADITFLVDPEPLLAYCGRKPFAPDPLMSAIHAKCQPMIDELLSVKKTVRNNSNEKYDSALEEFSAQCLIQEASRLPDIVKGATRRGENNLDLFLKLVSLEHESAIHELASSGADFLKLNHSGDNPITMMVSLGLVSILDEFGSYTQKMHQEWANETLAVQKNLQGRLQSILQTACARAMPNLDVIQLLVERHGANVNATSTLKRYDKSNEYTPLHQLARGTHWWYTKAVKYLVEHGADLEAKTAAGETPLLVTCRNVFESGHARIRILKVLLNAGANVNAFDNEGLTALNRAARETDIVGVLLKHGADPTLGKKPFIFDVIDANNIDVLRLLVESGADCNVRERTEDQTNEAVEDKFDVRNRGPLSYPLEEVASRRFDGKAEDTEAKSTALAMVNLLLVGGADPLLVSDNGNPILHNVASVGGIIEPLLKFPSLDIEARDGLGRTVLLAVCCSAWNAQILPLVLSKGASLQAQDNEGRNALHLAIKSYGGADQTPNTLRIILSHPDGPSLVFKRDCKGSTPLHYALRNSLSGVIDELLKQGADITEPDPADGNTALHHIAFVVSKTTFEKQAAYFQSLLDSGLDINSRNYLGETPIFRYIVDADYEPRWFGYSKDYLSNIDVFVNAGADFTVRNKRGESLLHKLAVRGSASSYFSWHHHSQERYAEIVEMFKWLMERGCEVGWEDCEQRTALDMAAASGNTAILKLFQRE